MKLPLDWQLPDSIQNRFGLKGAGKQRAMVAEGHLLLVLHQVPKADDANRKAVFFWRSFQGHWTSSSGSYGIQALAKHVSRYGDAEESLSQLYQQASSAEDYFHLLEAIAPLRLATKNLRTALQSAREGIPSDRDIIDLRDLAQDIERSLDLLHENAKNALDYKIAQRAEEQARWSLASAQAGDRLNILAAIFFPLTAVSCLFGMNIASGVEGASEAAFWAIGLGSIGLGLLVRRWVTSGKWL